MFPSTKKTIACLLVLCLILSCVPGSIFARAEDTVQQPNTANSAAFQLDADCQILQYVNEEVFHSGNHVARLKEEETLSTYVFLNADGTRTVYYMDENVKFRDENGEIQEKDIALTATAQGYTTVRNNIRLNLPASLKQGVTLSFSGYDVNLVPEDISLGTTVRRQDGKVAYLNCYGKATGLIYTPTLTGFKEDILLGEYTGVSSFSFLLNTDGLNVYQNEQGRYYLAAAEDASTRMEMADIVAYDANARHSLGSVTVTPITVGQQYRLTVAVDEEFLTAETTAYPVLIDPSITVSDSTYGAGAIEDASVYSLKPNMNAGTWTYNHAGYYDSTYGVARTAVRLTGLLADSSYAAASALDIQSAAFHLTEANWTDYATVNLYALNSNSTWTESNVTWNSIGTHYDTLYGTAQMGYGETAVFNITSLLKAWKNGGFSGGQCGFILVNTNETSVDKTLYSSEYGTTAYRPYVVVTYTLDGGSVELNEGATTTLSSAGITGTITWASSNTGVATVSNGVVTANKAGRAEITASVGGVVQKTFVVYVSKPDGVYFIKNVLASYYVGVEDGSIQNNALAKLMDQYTTYPDVYHELWKVTYISEGKYSIRPMHKLNMALKYVSSNTVIAEVGELDSLSSLSTYCLWTIEYDSDGYVIKNNGNNARALRASGTNPGNGASVVASAYSAGNSAFKWNLQIQAPANALLMYDMRVDDLAEDYATANAGAYVTTRSVKPGETLTVSQLGIAVGACTSDNNSQVVNWYSSDTSKATVNLSTGQVTGIEKGIVTITASRSFNNDMNVYSRTYKLVICDLPVSGYEIPYQPELWNTGAHMENLNCYAYALNHQYFEGAYNPGGINVGHFSNDPIVEDVEFDSETVLSRIANDAEIAGFTFSSIGKYEVCSPGTYKIVLVIAPGRDYHFYRQNPDGTWSHKTNHSQATCLDATFDDEIWDPCLANRDYSQQNVINCSNNYSQFVGYYQISPLNTMNPH